MPTYIALLKWTAARELPQSRTVRAGLTPDERRSRQLGVEI